MKWLAETPAFIEMEKITAVKCAVALHGYTWLELHEVARKLKCSFEDALGEVLTVGCEAYRAMIANGVKGGADGPTFANGSPLRGA